MISISVAGIIEHFSRSINISGVIICGKFSGNSVQTNDNLVILHSSKYAVQGRKKLEILRTFVCPFFKKRNQISIFETSKTHEMRCTFRVVILL